MSMAEVGDTRYRQADGHSRRSSEIRPVGLAGQDEPVKPSGTPSRPPLFTGVSAADYAAICATAHVKEFNRGELLHIEGEPVQHVLLLTTGFVKSKKIGMTGAEVILRVGAPGDMIGAVDWFSTGKYRTTAQVVRRCQAMVWNAFAFHSLVERYPVLYQNMVRIQCEDLLELEQRFHEVATERVGPRLARQLARVGEKIGRPVGGDVEIGLSQEELAQMAGTTLFTVSRLLTAWESSGMVKSRREMITILDLESLRGIAESNNP